MTAATESTPTARHPDLAGKLAVVTGGARGIGFGIARRLVAEGMLVVVADRDRPSLDRAVADLDPGPTRPGAVAGVEADVGRAGDVDRLFDRVGELVAEWAAPLHLLVNNAADLSRRPVIDEHDELLQRQLAVNVAGPYRCSQKAAALMAAAAVGDGLAGGVIVNLSSVGGTRAHHWGVPYDMTKGAIDALTRAMAIDLGPDGIRVNAVAPGVTHTHRSSTKPDSAEGRAVAERIPLARWGTVDDVAAAGAFLASDEAAYITGHVLFVDGGITAQLSPRGPDAL